MHGTETFIDNYKITISVVCKICNKEKQGNSQEVMQWMTSHYIDHRFGEDTSIQTVFDEVGEKYGNTLRETKGGNKETNT